MRFGVPPVQHPDRVGVNSAGGLDDDEDDLPAPGEGVGVVPCVPGHVADAGGVIEGRLVRRAALLAAEGEVARALRGAAEGDVRALVGRDGAALLRRAVPQRLELPDRRPALDLVERVDRVDLDDIASISMISGTCPLLYISKRLDTSMRDCVVLPLSPRRTVAVATAARAL